MHLAEKQLSVPQVMQPADLAVSKPDELSVITYLTYFCGPDSPGQVSLLLRIHKQIPGQKVSNFTTDWTSGQTLGALVNSFAGGEFPSFKQMGAEPSTENCRRSIDAAEQLLGVKKTISPEDFANPTLDQLVRVGYLAQFCHTKMKIVLLPAAADKVEVSYLQVPEDAGGFVWLQLDCSRAGYGVVRAEATGTVTGKIHVHVEETSLAKYRVKFQPKKVDIYTLAILYGDNHITGSPFTINLHQSDPGQVCHLSTSIPEEADQSVALAFDISKAGRGELIAEANGELGGAVPVTIEPQPDGNFTVSFKPLQPDMYEVDVKWGTFSAHAMGDTVGPVPIKVEQQLERDYTVSFNPPHPDVYKVNVNWGGKPVPGSPFTINLLPPAAPDKVECADPIYTAPGAIADLLVDISNAGSGTLTAQCNGKECGDVSVNITKVARRAYQVSFTPPKEDVYTLSVFFEGTQVKCSPFTIDMSPGTVPLTGVMEEQVPDATKCVAVGVKETQGITYVQRTVSFSVDTTGAGCGHLEVTVDGPSLNEEPPRLEVQPNKDRRGVFDITYIPTAPGSHLLSLNWSNVPIPGSPFKFTVIDNAQLQTYMHGKPIGIELEVDCKISDVKAYAVHKDTSTHLKVKLTKAQKGKMKLSFQPKEPGLYFIHVSIKDKEIPTSPYIVRYGKPPKPDACIVTGLPDRCYINEPLAFVVDTKDGGSGELLVKVAASKLKKEKPDISITDNRDGTFSVDYVPRAGGEHMFSVSWSGRAVPSSPFHVTAVERTPEKELVADASKCMIIGLENIPTSAFVDKLLTFKVDARAAGPGDLDVSAEGPSDDQRPSKLEVGHNHGEQGIHEVSYTPTAPGLHKLHLKWANEPIPSSPVSLQVITPKTFEQGKPVTMDISADCKPAEIESYAIHEESGERHKVKLTRAEKGKFKLSFQPKEPGIYSVHVLIKQRDIPSSPFRIKYGPLSRPENCLVYGLSDTADVGKPVTFTIDAREAGSGQLNIRASGPSRGEKPELSVIDNNDGTFLATYIPNGPGDHHFDITWGGEPIPRSPLCVSVEEPLFKTDDSEDLFNIIQDLVNKPSEIAIPEFQEESALTYKLPEVATPKREEITIPVGTPVRLTVKPQSEQQKTGELTAVAAGEKDGKSDTQISQNPDGTFEVCFNSNDPDRYTLNVKLDDKHVPKSPFIVNYIPAPVPEVVEAVVAQEVESLPTDYFGSFQEEETPFTLEAEAETTDIRQEKQELTNYIGRSTLIKVRPQTEQQRKGEVVAIATGSNTGPTDDITVTKLPDDTYEVDFHPTKPDRYTLEVTLDNSPIPRSPVIIRYILPPCDPNKCKIVGLEDLPQVLMINKEVHLVVDAQQAGPGELEIKADGPSPLELRVVQREGQKGTFDVTCIPAVPGNYSLEFLWDGSSVPQSPVKLVVVDMDTVATTAYGRSATVDIDVSCKPADLRVYALHEGSTTQLKVKINQGQKGKYKLTFQPKEPGFYYIHIFVKENEIPGSPIVIRYAKPPKPEACKVIGLTKTAYAGETLTFTVDVTEAGGGELQVRALGPGGKERGTLNVGERKDDTYLVEYIPSAPGKHQFQISWAGKAIPGSPYPLSVRDYTKEELISWLFLVDRVGTTFPADLPEEGQRVEIHTTTDNSLLLRVKAQTPKQKKGVLTASAIGKEVGLTGAKVTKRSDDMFEALFTPPKPDQYTLKASLGGEEVPLTPVTVFYATAPPDPSKCRVLGLENVPPLVQVSKEISFQVDTRLAGDGKLKLTVNSPPAKEAPKLSVKPSEKEPLVFDVSYLPTAAGVHTLTLTWSGEPLLDSPLRFDVDPVQTQPYGKLISIEIDAEYKTSELESYAIHLELGTRHKVKISKVRKGRLRFAVQAKEPGLYGIHILVRRIEIPGSPFNVRYDMPPKPEAVLVHGLKGTGCVSELVSFVVDANSAGSGELNIKVKGPKKGEQPQLKIRDNKNGTYTTEYTPNSPGDHQFDVTWSGTPVPGSPFHLNVTEPAVVPVEEYALKLSLLEELPPQEYTVVVGRPINFTIPIEETEAKLTATASGAKSGEVAVNLSQNMDGTCSVQFCPEKPDRYTVNVKLNDEHVPRSPFIVNYVTAPPDPTKCKVYGKEKIPEIVMAKQKVNLIVDARQAGSGSLDVRAEAPMLDQEPPALVATPRKEDPRLVEITYTPTAAGMHTLHLLWTDKEIPDSPISFPVAVPNQVILTPPDNIELNVPVCYHANTILAGSGILTATCSGTTSGYTPVQIKKQREFEYNIAYTPIVPDNYNLSIKWAGREIPNSPFSVTLLPLTPAEQVVVPEPVKKPQPITEEVAIAEEAAVIIPEVVEEADFIPPDILRELEKEEPPQEIGMDLGGEVVKERTPEEFTIMLGRATKLKIRPQDEEQRKGKLLATVSGENTGPANSKVSQDKSGNFEVFFNPTEADRYTLDMKFKDKPLPRGPFILNYVKPPSDPSKCRLLGKENIPAVVVVNEDVFLQVDTREAGYGTLDIKAEAPTLDQYAPKLVAIPSKEAPRISDVKYTPTAAGIHTLHFQWAKEEIPESPVSFPVVDPGMVAVTEPDKVELLSPAHFQVDALYAGPGRLTGTCTGARCGNVPINVNAQNGARYDVSFIPLVPDTYSLSISWAGREIPNSPFSVTLLPLTPAEQVVVTEPVLPEPGRPTDVLIDTGGKGTLTANCIGEECGKVPVQVVNTGEGKHKITFTPQAPDLYRLHMFYDDTQVKGSPFEFDLRKPKVVEAVQVAELAQEESSYIPAEFEDSFGVPAFTLEADGEKEGVTEVEKKAPEEFTNFVGTALVVKVRPQSEEQRKGQVVATAIGESTGTAEIGVSQRPDDSYEVTFNPSQPDRYTVDIQLNEQPIPRSPFVVKYIMPPSDPSKCKIIGVEDLPAVLEVNKEITLMVDASKAGPGDLEVTADGPSSDLEPSKLAAKLREGEASTYEVTYIPTSQGTHTLNFLWGGKSIPQSPVKLVVIELARVEVHQYGKPVGLDIDSDCKPSELRAYALQEGSETQLRVKLNKLPRGKYRLSFQPKQPGLYYIHIFERNTELTASPIVIRYAKPPKPEACKVIGISTTTYMGETLTFTVDVTEAGGGELQVRALGPGGKERGTLNVGERKDDTYLVEYIPSAPGKHQFQISWAGKAIPGSPYPLSVRDHTKEELISWLFLVDQLGASQPADLPEEGQRVEIHTTTDNSLLLRVKAQTPKQKKGVLTATATGEKTGSIKLKSTKTSQDTFEALFSPPAADNYTIEAKLNQEQVPNTPVNVIYSTPPPDPSKCRIIGLESIPPILQVDKPIPFKVDTRFAGSGKLNIAADGPVAEERPKLQAAAGKDEPAIVDIVYTPTAAGTHTLNLTWSGESIPGSPLTFEVSPIHTHAHGRPVGVDINIDCKSSELESYAIHEETGSRYRVKVSKVEKGKFKISFQPNQPGLYGVHILIRKKAIAGSPFYLRYDSPPKADAVAVRGLSDTGYIREPIDFVVDTTDAGNGDLVIKVKSPATKEEKPELTITDNKDKTYSVGYTPNAPGDHQFDVAWSGKGVPGSPFGVNVLQPITEEVPLEEAAVIIPEVVEEADFIPPDILRELEKEEPPQEIGMDLGGEVVKERTPEEFTIMLGRATKLKIRPQDEEQRKGKLLATVSGENTGPANSKVSQDKSGNFEVFFNPTEADRYTLDMKFKDKPLPRGPFILNYVKPPSDPSKCRLLGKENIPAVVVVNEDVFLQVDTREAGYGTLDIKAEAPTLDQYAPKLVAIPSKEAPRISDVKYTPTAAGIHTLHFQWAKEEIPESPVSFPVVDPGMVAVTEPDKVELLSPAHFQVDALYAGPGRLTGTCTGARCGNVPINVNAQNGARYDVSFIPLVPDTYSLSISWAGREIPNSPFSVTLLPLTPAEQVVVTEPVLPEPGRPTDVLIDTGGKGTLTANCIGEECGKVPVQVVNTGEGKHKITFTPQAPDLYRLHMFYDDTQVKGSPFEFDLRKPKVVEAVQVAELAQEESSYIPAEFEDSFGVPAFTLEADGQKEGVTEVEKKAPEEFTNFVGTALVVKVRPQSEEQRKGQVVATAIGESTGTAEIGVSQRPDDSYEVTFNPSQPDRYTVDIQLNEQPIPRSPFVVKYIMPPSDPSKCKIIGVEDLPAVLEVNKEITLMVDASKAGPGDLEVTADGPSSDLEPSKLAAKLREGEASTYEVTYIPTSQGTHTLNFLWGGKSIPQSPVKLVVIELARVEVHQYGKPVGLDIDSDCKPSELRAYALQEGSETQLRVKLNKLPRGKYRLSFQPKQPGLYYIHIFERNTELTASPIVIRYAKPPKPEACKVIGISTTTYMGETLTFTVDVTEAGGGELQVRALGPGGKERGTLNVGERKDDTYLVEYIPSAPGKHQFQISWAGKAIPGSPYPLSVRDHTKEELISWLFLVDQLGASQPADLPEEGQRVEIHTTTDNSLLLRVKAQTPKQKKGVLTATATGEKTGSIKLKSTKTSQDTFEALFSPPAADNYTIEAKLNQEQVPNTPVNVIYSTPPPDPSKCRIIGLESIPPILQVDKPIPFKVDTRFAGSGKLNIAADGPVAEERPKLQAAAGKDEPAIVDIVYTPTAAGTHTLNLTWSGESIPGSPLTFEVSPIHTHAHGRPVGVDINIDCKSSELESYAIHEETGSRYRVKVSKVEKGKFKISFQPNQPGLYGVHILIRKKAIAGSPFYLRYDSPPKADAVAVRGLSDTGYIREPIDFVVDTTDAGNGDLVIKVKSPATKEEKPELTITDNKDKTYSVGYTPNAPGDHQFDVAWSGKGVPGSPFGVNVLQPITEEVPLEEAAVIIPEVVEEADFIPPDILRELEKEEPPQEIGMDLGGEVVKERTPEEFTIMLGRATKLKIRPQDEEQRKGKLLATVSGENTGPANSKVSQDKSGNFEVFFNPTEADRYTLDMKFKDKPLPRGPFILNYVKPPSDPSKCRLLGKENIPAVVVVNEDVFLQVDTREAGYGTLDIKAEAPTLDQYAPKLVAIPSKEAPRISDVKYTPTAAGIHTLHFQWAKEEIPESPVSFPVVDPGMVAVTEPDKVELLSPAHFQVDALYAGPGRLTGTCTGARCGNVPINVNAQNGARYDVSFIPLVPDTYSLSISWAGREIPNSPFSVTLLPLTPAEQVVVTEPVLPEPGRPTDVLIDTGGKGTLTANCIGEECGKVPVQVVNTGEGKHKITFTPQAPDLYRLHMFYDDTQVKGSPFEFDLRKPKVVEAVQVAELAQEESSYIPAEFEDSFGVPAFTLEADGQKEGVTEVEKKAPEEFTNFVGTALVVKVRPQSEEQRKGQVVATAIGESTGTAEIGVSQRPDDSYEVTFNPSQPDRYTVDIQLNEQPIPRSPFVVKYIMPPSDPSKCKIIGVEDLPAVLEVNKEITLMVDASKAGPGDLEVTADGPSSDLEPSKLAAKLREGEASTYEVTYIPTSQGTHTLNFLWGGKSIPQSPVKLVVIELARVEVHQYGKPVGLDIDSDCKPSELRAYALQEGSETQLRVKLNKLPRGKYRLSFQPKQPGLYYIHIFERNTELTASPIVIRYAKPPKPEACKVIGISTTTYMGETLTFTVDVTEAGGGELQVRALGPGGKERGTLNVGERKDDTYLVEYIPSAPGKHQFQISWAGKAIPGSPYPLSVRDHTKEELISWLFLVDQLGASQPADLPEEGQRVEIHTTTDNSLLLRVKAQTPKQKKGVLTATATGEKTGSIKLKSTKTSQDTFEALFSPPAADNYTIEAKLNQEQVPNTPVNVIYSTPPPDPSKCRIIGLESIPPILQVDKPIPFKVDTRFAGSGKLNIAADGPVAEERPKLQAAAGKDEPAIVDIVYTPTAAGTHTLNLTWSGESIPGSPLTFEVSPIHTHAHGRPVGVDINIDCKSSELESYAIHEETGSRYRVKVSKVEKGKFKISFQPNQPGLYGVHILIRKKAIAGSPFYLRYDSPPKADAVAVRGLSDTGYIREPIDFVVDTTDAGNGDLVIKVKSPATKEEKPELTITDNKDKTYSVGYTPNAPGDHQFDVAWSGKGVPGSPFGVNVLQPITEEVPLEEAAVIIPEVVEEADFIPPDILRELEKEEPPQEIGMDLGGEVVKERTPEEFTIMLGRATKLKIRPQDEEQRKGKLLATVSGENTGPANSKVSQDKSGNFEVFFNPTEADRYTLDMKFKDKPLPRGPFILNYVKPPSDPSKCRLLGKENIPAVVVVNEDVFLQVDTREAGYGTLDIKAEAPTLDQYAPKLVAIPSKEAPRISDVKYTPTAAGIHTLHFQWAKEEIPESPVSFPVVDPGMVAVTEPDKVELLSPAHFQVDALYAGPGRLTGTCTGARCGNVPINVNAQNGARYDVSFIPLVPDTYSLSISWAGREIPNSPFSITLLPLTPVHIDQVEKVEKVKGDVDTQQVTGLNLENKTFQVGIPCFFKVDCDAVDRGVFEIGCNPPTAASIQITPDAGNRTYQCRILPSATGDVEIVAQYNGQHIHGSPFHVHFKPPAAANLALSLSAEGIETSNATATIESTATLEQIPSILTQLIGGQYNIEFDPTKGLEYLLTFKCLLRVKSEEQALQDSPFRLSYVQRSINASLCSVESEGLDAVHVGQWGTLIVSTEGAGQGELKVNIEGSGTKEPQIVITPIDGNKFQLKFMLPNAGTYRIHITWGGEEIPGSPFVVHCSQPATATSSLFNISDIPTEALLGKTILFNVVPKGRVQEGKLTVTARSSHHGTTACKVSKKDDGSYTCSIKPVVAGKYLVNIYWNGTPLSGCPFKLKVLQPPKPQNVRAHGPGLADGNVGQEGNFVVETTDAGAGTLSVNVEGPKGGFQIQLNRDPERERVILAQYNPANAGVYIVGITWSGSHIPGSPFTVNIHE